MWCHELDTTLHLAGCKSFISKSRREKKNLLLLSNLSCQLTAVIVYGFKHEKVVVKSSVCCSTQTKYWIPVLETYWSIITSMAFQKILVQYQYSIEILNYFPVSLSVFQKKFRGPKFENSIFLKINHFRKNIVINFFSCPLSNFSQEMPNC